MSESCLLTRRRMPAASGRRRASGTARSTDERAAAEESPSSHLIPFPPHSGPGHNPWSMAATTVPMAWLAWAATHNGRILFLGGKKEPCLLAKTELTILPPGNKRIEYEAGYSELLIGFQAAASCYTNLVTQYTPHTPDSPP